MPESAQSVYPTGSKLHRFIIVLCFGGLLSIGASKACAAPASGGEWTFINGTAAPMAEALGNYGSLGIGSPDNQPGHHFDAAKWTDSSGNIYMFGGYGYGESSSGLLNDFWKYDAAASHWIWLGGSKEISSRGSYGTRGVANPANYPGARYMSSAWTDTSGTLWLFGGVGFNDDAVTTQPGMLNDLWNYDPDTNLWTWISGSSGYNAPDVSVVDGMGHGSNTPSSRHRSATWTDHENNLWLFGGEIYGGETNDLWKYDTEDQFWIRMRVYRMSGAGNLGQEAPGISPAPRVHSATWVDNLGRLYLFGGQDSFFRSYTDLWRYNPATNYWAWIAGSTSANMPGFYGTMGVAAPSNNPPSRNRAAAWTDDNGRLWLFGGRVEGGLATQLYGELNDLWVFNPTTARWTWMKGSNQSMNEGSHGAEGEADLTYSPGARHDMFSWKSTSGTLHLRGGTGWLASGGLKSFDDTWSFNGAINSWTWHGGETTIARPAEGQYGSQGQADPANQPPPREEAATWLDSSGKLWMYSGDSRHGMVPNRRFDDLWLYNPETQLWTWADGDMIGPAVQPVLGELSTPGPATTPGKRAGAATWTDASDNLWLFGGNNDNHMFKYDVTLRNWIWMKAATTNSLGVYGNLGVPDPANAPGMRSGANTWTDSDGNFWLFGGLGKDASSPGKSLDDLWKYNPEQNMWTWMGGSTTGNGSGSPGTMGMSSPDNWPASRHKATMWKVNSAVWIFGGDTRGMDGGGWLDDLWKLDLETGEWTWVDGQIKRFAAAAYGEKGVETEANTPGARSGAAGWIDAQGNLVLFGGNTAYLHNDLWKFNITSGQWSWIGGPDTPDQGSVLGSSTDKTPGARANVATWHTPAGTTYIFGGYGTGEVSGSAMDLNDFWRFAGLPPTAGVDWDTAILYD